MSNLGIEPVDAGSRATREATAWVLIRGAKRHPPPRPTAPLQDSRGDLLVHPDQSMVYPDDLKYTPEHEWVRIDDGTVRVGITAYAQQALGDIVFVSLPEIGTRVRAGQPFGEVESTKSVSDVFAPVAGRVVARNETLQNTPELVNSDPYGEGWLVELEVSDTAAVEGLLDGAAYKKLVEEH